MRHDDPNRAVMATNRFGLGARPGEIEAAADDPARWLRGQLSGPPGAEGAWSGLTPSRTVVADFQAQRERQRQARQAGDTAQGPGRMLRGHYLEQVLARYRAAASTPQPFRERLVHFWANHFAVSIGKPPVTGLAGLLEHEAIRPHVTGRFEDLLLAVERHPAMLTYLDNVQSVGPNSSVAKRRAKRRAGAAPGLNENLAREVLELHTLGVDGGYAQADVLALARALTGWSLGGGRGARSAGTPGEFHFREAVHEPGAVEVLGRRYGQRGEAQAEAVLRDLAAHPATARHLAFKLARHFVADEPPAALVERLTDTYGKTGGDLAAVCETLVDSPEAWAPGPAKFKTPHDFVVSTFRALGYVPDDARVVVGALDALGQPTWRPGSPAGWPDTAERWAGGDALTKRVEWAGAVAQRAARRRDPTKLASAALGPSLGTATRTAVARAESREQAVTLLLMSPEFQRRA